MNEDNNKKGFAGLSSLTSNIEGHAPVDPPKCQPETSKEQAQKKSKLPAPRESKPSTPPQPKPPSEKSGSSGWKWLLGIVAVVAIVAVYNNNQRSRSPSAPSTYTSPTTSYGTGARNSTTQPVATSKPKPAPFRPEPEITFERPPVGRDNVLSIAQIRWCLREDMGVEVKKPLIENNAQVAEFNRSVDDYNRRCGSFRYRGGNLERAKQEVENLRTEIEREARLQFQPAIPQIRQSSPTVQVPSRVSPTPGKEETGPSASEVRDVQRLLTKLGYDPGPIDGQFGRRTANAIKRFQKDSGRSVTGKLDSALITALKAAGEKVSRSSPLIPVDNY